jgi:hypothetical protein
MFRALVFASLAMIASAAQASTFVVPHFCARNAVTGMELDYANHAAAAYARHIDSAYTLRAVSVIPVVSSGTGLMLAHNAMQIQCTVSVVWADGETDPGVFTITANTKRILNLTFQSLQ